MPEMSANRKSQTPQTRDASLLIRLTPTEKEKIVARANDLGLDQSAYARSLMLADIRRAA